MQTKVKRRPLGDTGVMVSEVGLGAMNLRQLPDHETVIAFLNAVLDTGINLIDTARAYETRESRTASNRTGVFISSEEMLGRVIAAREDIDEPLVLITKGHAYTPEAMDEQLEKSYKALQLRKESDGLYIGKTKIYLAYLLHGIKDDRWGDVSGSGVLDHAKKHIDAGDFTWLGFSSHYGDAGVIKKAIDTGSFKVCELPYNVYNPSLGEEGETDLIKYACDHGIGVINMKAFNGNGTKAIFPQIAGYSGFGYGEMLRYCLANPYIASIDAGAVNMEEFNADIEAALLPAMTAGERSALREKAKKLSPFLSSICRECMHCVEKFECPNDIDFPRILGLHGRYTVSSGMGLPTDAFRTQYGDFSPGADACIECGQCVPWCEYHLDIPAMMKAAAADLG
jgi:predicted aldo/keto reductase-like oxidoreductase